jgi:hypothetical protein
MSRGESNYSRARRERIYEECTSNARPSPNLDQARTELSEAISRVATSLFQDKYGPLMRVLSQPVVNEFLKVFEAKISSAKGDFTLVFEELLERAVPKISVSRSR